MECMYSLSETPCTTAGPRWSLTLDDGHGPIDVGFPPRPLPVADEPGTDAGRALRAGTGSVPGRACR